MRLARAFLIAWILALVVSGVFLLLELPKWVLAVVGAALMALSIWMLAETVRRPTGVIDLGTKNEIAFSGAAGGAMLSFAIAIFLVVISLQPAISLNGVLVLTGASIYALIGAFLLWSTRKTFDAAVSGVYALVSVLAFSGILLINSGL